jgi:hypothetical protein
MTVLHAVHEIRIPKAEIRRKPEYRNPNQTHPLVFGLRVSGFFRISSFVIRIFREAYDSTLPKRPRRVLLVLPPKKAGCGM